MSKKYKVIWSEQDSFSLLFFEHTRVAKTLGEAKKVAREKKDAGLKGVRIEEFTGLLFY